MIKSVNKEGIETVELENGQILLYDNWEATSFGANEYKRDLERIGCIAVIVPCADCGHIIYSNYEEIKDSL